MTIGTALAILKEIANTPVLLKEIYGDLAKPGVSQVGKALGTVLGLGNTLLLPLTLFSEKSRLIFEKNLEKFREELAAVPEDQVVSIPPEVGVPIVEKLTYVADEEISDLYVNLLAKASTIQTSALAHPSFANIINNLSPDEAQIIKFLREKPQVPFLDVNLTVNTASGEFLKILEVRTAVEGLVTLQYPGNCGAYFSNLSGLGIIDIRRDISVAADAAYKALEEVYGAEIRSIIFSPESQRVNVLRGKIEVTAYGSLFINACSRRLPNIEEPKVD